MRIVEGVGRREDHAERPLPLDGAVEDLAARVARVPGADLVPKFVDVRRPYAAAPEARVLDEVFAAVDRALRHPVVDADRARHHVAVGAGKGARRVEARRMRSRWRRALPRLEPGGEGRLHTGRTARDPGEVKVLERVRVSGR